MFAFVVRMFRDLDGLLRLPELKLKGSPIIRKGLTGTGRLSSTFQQARHFDGASYLLLSVVALPSPSPKKVSYQLWLG